MAYVPLSVEDLDRAAQAVRRHAVRLLVGKQRDPHEAALHRDLANRFEAAGRMARQPVVPEDAARPRAGQPPGPVDTFPSDHHSRKSVGEVATVQEDSSAASVGDLKETKGLCPECETCKPGGNCPPEHFGEQEKPQ